MDEQNDIAEYEKRYACEWLTDEYIFLGSNVTTCDVKEYDWNQFVNSQHYPYFQTLNDKFRLKAQWSLRKDDLGIISGVLGTHANFPLKQGLIIAFGKYEPITKSEKKDEKAKTKICQSQEETFQQQELNQKVQELSRVANQKNFSQSKKVKIFLALKKEAFKRKRDEQEDSKSAKENCFTPEIENLNHIFRRYECVQMEDNKEIQQFYDLITNDKSSQNSSKTVYLEGQIFDNPRLDLRLTDFNSEEITHDHQKQALTWLLIREGVHLDDNPQNVQSPLWIKFKSKFGEQFYFNRFTGQLTQEQEIYTGGILADDNGFSQKQNFLGLILSHESDNPNERQTLIVTKHQQNIWNNILKPKLENKVTLYTENLNLEQFDVIIMTYYQLRKDHQDFQKREEIRKQSEESRKKGFIIESEDTSESIIFKQNWYRIILDQSSIIKNPDTQLTKACLELKGSYRWCITSMPSIQNNFKDIITTLQFIKHKQMPFPYASWFKKYIEKPYKKNEQITLKVLKSFLSPMVLRRTKESQYKNNQKMIYFPNFEKNQVNIRLNDNEFSVYEIIKNQKKDFLGVSSEMRRVCDYYKMKEIKQIVEDITRASLENLKPNLQDAEYNELRQEILKKINETNQKCDNCKSENKRFRMLECEHFLCKKCFKRASQQCSIFEKCPVDKCNMKNPNFLEMDYVFTNDWQKTYTPSSKILEIRKIVNEIPIPEKCIIFTQFHQMIEVIKYDFEQQGLNSIQIDLRFFFSLGHKWKNLRQIKKKCNSRQFQGQRRKKNVLLVSLKADLKIRLPNIKHVILVDPWWQNIFFKNRNYCVSERVLEEIFLNEQDRYEEEEINVYTLICENTIEVDIHHDNIKKKLQIGEKLTQDEWELHEKFQRAQRGNDDLQQE